jgi:hypothetical protein
MKVLIYVNTRKEVGDVDHLKVRNADAAETWFEENDPEGVAFEYEGMKRIGRLAIFAVLLIVALLSIWQVFGAAWE